MERTTEIDGNCDNIVEPGETITMSSITFKNTGLMLTPTQPFTFSLKTNNWIICNNQVGLNKRLKPGQSYSLSENLLFSISDTHEVPNDPLVKTAK